MKGRAVLVLTYWSFNEALIQNYTLPYVAIIQKRLGPESKVFLVTLEKPDLAPSPSEAEGLKSELQKSGLYWLPVAYFPFGLRAALRWFVVLPRLIFLVMRKRISVIHCWCTPAGAAGYILSRLTGKKLVVDSYEPHAEAMVENGTWKKDSLAFRILFRLERLQTQRAAVVISATAGMRDYALAKYGIVVERFYVKPACVDLALFSKKNKKDPQLVDQLGLTGKIVCVYAGKFGGIYLNREVFDFLKVAFEHWGDAFRALLLTNHPAEEIRKYSEQAALPAETIITAFVPHDKVPSYIGLGDFAITPVKPVPTKKYCTPIKDGEYWALGLPVVIPAGISDDSTIISENDIGAVLPELNREAYREAVLKIDFILQRPAGQTFDRIRAVAARYRSFGIAEKIYQEIYGE